MALYGQCRAGAQINFPESGRGLGHVTTTIFGSTVGYPSESLASCTMQRLFNIVLQRKSHHSGSDWWIQVLTPPTTVQ